MQITIVDEFNCYNPPNGLWLHGILLKLGIRKRFSYPGSRSLWICSAAYDPNKDDHNFVEMGTKIIGPIHAEKAQELLDRIELGLKNAGIVVTIEAAGDD